MGVLKFVIVGHVDHGKSTLIGRLLFDTDSLSPDKMAEVKEASKALGRQTEFAFLLDHLREEREQGITIDTTQTFFKTNKREYVIIDAPGHREFIKNMITGASQAEAAILIIDVEQGMKEQTTRHAYILAILGIKQVIVILNKMDLIGFDIDKFNQVKDEVLQFLDSINIRAKSYIPVSALKGDNVAKKSENIGWYDGPTVLESLDSLEGRITAENKPLVFPVQDVYKVDSKRIIVGRIEAGLIRRGQEIKILPQGQTAKINSIEKFLENPEICYAGESIGVTTAENVFLERGNVVCAMDEKPALTDTFRANIFWMAGDEFDKQERFTLRCATQEVYCKIEKIIKRMNSSTLKIIQEDADKLSNLEVGEIIIKTKKEIVVKRFNELEELGRFVLVKGENTCAGGIVTAMI
jgi:sulfate adenylyltransferase large subunit